MRKVKRWKSEEKIIATVTRKGEGACNKVLVEKGGKKIATFNVVNNTPKYFVKSMVRNMLNSDENTLIIVRERQNAMTV